MEREKRPLFLSTHSTWSLSHWTGHIHGPGLRAWTFLEPTLKVSSAQVGTALGSAIVMVLSSMPWQLSGKKYST